MSPWEARSVFVCPSSWESTLQGSHLRVLGPHQGLSSLLGLEFHFLKSLPSRETLPRSPLAGKGTAYVRLTSLCFLWLPKTWPPCQPQILPFFLACGLLAARLSFYASQLPLSSGPAASRMTQHGDWRQMGTPRLPSEAFSFFLGMQTVKTGGLGCWLFSGLPWTVPSSWGSWV